MTKLLKKLGGDFAKLRGIHGLRHTHATQLMKSGVNARVIQERLGHADVAFTLRTYTHPDEEMHREAAARIDEMYRRKP